MVSVSTPSGLAGDAPSADGAASGAAQSHAYYSITQAAARLGVSRMTVWRWIRSGELTVARLGHRTARISHAELERLLYRHGSNGFPKGLPPEWREAGATEHFVQFYEADDSLLQAVIEYAASALRAGDSVVIIATAEHRTEIERRLRLLAPELDSLIAGGRYVALDAAETLNSFIVDGNPDQELFESVIGDVIQRAAAAGRRVRAFGEMVGLLVDREEPEAALRLEEMWNQLQTRYPFSLFCGYRLDGFGGEALAAQLAAVCDAHARVIPAESYTALRDPDERQRAIAVLQQKAQSLEAEVAERRRAEAALQAALDAEREAREAAEQALRLRDEFLSIAAHELRTPLTSLMGHAQLLSRVMRAGAEVTPSHLEGGLEAIRTQSLRLNRLVSQLMDVTRLEADKLRIERQGIDVADLVVEVVAAAQARTTRHRISLATPERVQVMADPLRLEQVLVNLVDNAVKYSPEGGDVRVTVERTPDGGARISVQDQGIGIPPEQRDRIFERYYQAHAAGSMSGLGLGLYISKQIVDQHGGTIAAEFPAEGGTRFVVTLPAS